MLPLSLKFQSPAKKLEGEGKNSLVMNLLGSADTGVSIKLLEALEAWLCCETGWGRAKGFGGPDAPAERRAEAEGEGGGRTTEDEFSCDCPFRRCFAVLVPDRGELESAVADPPSEASSGICKLRAGRFAPVDVLFVREGVWNPSGTDDMDVLRVFRL